MKTIVTLLPFIVIIGAMFLMTRSAKNKQRAAERMRDQMQPGTGVRTIGGLYATVKEVGHDVVTLEIAPGVHTVFAKNAIGAVLDEEEYHRIVTGEPDAGVLKSDDAPVVPDSPAGLDSIDLTKGEQASTAVKGDAAEDPDGSGARQGVDPQDSAAEGETRGRKGDENGPSTAG